MRWAKWIGGAVWAGSWYLMYLEITRWRHVKPSLKFNSDLERINGMRPRPGLPLILLYVACGMAPLVVIAALARQFSDAWRNAGP
jgi:hypothetical protein